MKLRATLALLFLLLSPLPARGDGKEKVVPKTLAELESEIRKVLADTKTPGIGIALVSREGVMWAGGLGQADVASGRPATADTLFRIGSISKGFVALSVLALVEEGRLSLDDTIRSLAPEIAFDNPWEATDPVRLVHVLEHTAGFDDIHLREYALSEPRIALVDALAYDPRSRVSRWRPGTRMSYCNSGPPIAAYIVAKLSGMPFEQFVGERFFAPLGMRTATYFESAEAKPLLATLYRADGKTPFPYWHISLRPSGSINASAAEMANYVRFYLGRGAFEGQRLLSAASIERMETPATTWGARAGLTTGYGLNNYVTQANGFVYHGHDGGVAGGIASLAYLPQAGLGYAYMINGGSGEAAGDIGTLIRNHLTRDLPQPPAPAVVAVPAEVARRFSGHYRPASPRQEMLRFLERLLGTAHLEVTADGLTVSPIQGEARRYVAVSERLFRARGKEGEEEERAASVALLDEEEGLFVETSGSTRERVSSAGVWSERAVGMAALALILAAPLFALVWVPRALFGRLRGLRTLAVRIVPLLAVLCFAGLVAVMIVASGDAIPRLGKVTGWSLGLTALSVLFAFFSLLGLGLALRTPASEMNRWARRYCLALSVANVTVAAYLAYWGWIGIRTWV